jgi:hypothetical protein
VDAISAEGADWLAEHVSEWEKFFLELGQALAELD